MHNPSSHRGSILFVLFASVAMVGVVGVTSMNMMKGPVRAMAQVTKRTIAENNIIASGRLVLILSAQDTGDCDADGMVEPLPWVDRGANVAPLNGGLLPSTIGAALMDPWGNEYGYCAWDHGTVRLDDACGQNANRLKGANSPEKIVIAIMSAGPDKVFQTGCRPDGGGDYLLRLPGNDDVVLSYSFAEAMALSGGLWTLKQNDVQTATIAKNLSVTDTGGDEQLTFNADTKALSIGSGGTGEMTNIRTDYIQNLSSNAPVEFLSEIKAMDVSAAGKVTALEADITTAEANAVAAIITSSGNDGIGLKAGGTSKAIEADGILDMTGNKITNLLTPSDDNDAATKKYVDDKAGGPQKTKCESFVFTGCTGSSPQNLTKTNLGACKKSCEAANVQCCEAEFASLPGNPNAMLTNCHGFNAPSQTNGGLRNILTILLGGGKHVSALCYLE
jgi:hypothetical protein